MTALPQIMGALVLLLSAAALVRHLAKRTRASRDARKTGRDPNREGIR